MTKIKDLLQMPVGQGTGGYMMYVKTFKKRYEVAGRWRQQCICVDDTGELLVEVNLKGNTKLSREFRVVVGKMMEMDWMNKTRKALLVYEYTEPTQTPDEWMEQADKVFEGEMNEIRGKIRHGLVCAFVQSRQIEPDITSGQPYIPKSAKNVINDLVEFIITGK